MIGAAVALAGVSALLSSPGQVALQDDAGVTVSLAAPPRRIVSLAPSNTETLYLIGAGELLVGATRYDDYPPQARGLPRVGGFLDVDIERVLALDPDLVLAAGFQANGPGRRLRALGVPVFTVEPRDAAATIDRVEVIGTLVGRAEEARRVAAGLRARLDAVQRAVARASVRPRVLLMLSRDLFTVGPGSFAHDLIVRAGGDNIAADAGVPYPQISDETVILRDPQIIFIGGHQTLTRLGDLRLRPGWAEVSAVRAGRVVVLEDPDIASRPGPRIIDALELIAAEVERFQRQHNGSGLPW
jgi:iron complex transport system substrate-binding protein